MAKLPEEIITTVLNLQKKLLESIDEATAVLFIILEQYGETDETIPELDELQSLRDRVETYYTRFYANLKRIYEAQPVASYDNLELLNRSIDEAQSYLKLYELALEKFNLTGIWYE